MLEVHSLEVEDHSLVRDIQEEDTLADTQEDTLAVIQGDIRSHLLLDFTLDNQGSDFLEWACTCHQT